MVMSSRQRQCGQSGACKSGCPFCAGVADPSPYCPAESERIRRKIIQRQREGVFAYAHFHKQAVVQVKVTQKSHGLA